MSSSQKPLPTRHTTNTRHEHPFPRRDSSPRSQLIIATCKGEAEYRYCILSNYFPDLSFVSICKYIYFAFHTKSSNNLRTYERNDQGFEDKTIKFCLWLNDVIYLLFVSLIKMGVSGWKCLKPGLLNIVCIPLSPVLLFSHPQSSVSFWRHSLLYLIIQAPLSLSPMWFLVHPLTPLRLYKKSCCVPISVFLVLYKPATSPCGWKPEWKKRGHSKNNHTYTNTLTYGTTTLRSSYAPRHGDGEDWHVLSFVTWRHNYIRHQRKTFQFHDILVRSSKSVI
jgi:hypothetical protein